MWLWRSSLHPRAPSTSNPISILQEMCPSAGETLVQPESVGCSIFAGSRTHRHQNPALQASNLLLFRSIDCHSTYRPTPPWRVPVVSYTLTPTSFLTFAGFSSSRGLSGKVSISHIFSHRQGNSNLLGFASHHLPHLKRMLASIARQLTLCRSNWTVYQASQSRPRYMAENCSLYSYR